MNNIESNWQRIAAWYDANTPGGTFVLADGATEQQLADFEKEIGFEIPPDLRESFALHNGTVGDGYLLHWGELLTLERVLYWHREYSQWQQSEDAWGLEPDYRANRIEGPIKPIWWNSFRLVLTDNSGDSIMADFDPPSDGNFGQIIEFDHEIGPCRVLASSWSQLLGDIADGLERGDYIYFEEEETVAPPDIGW